MTNRALGAMGEVEAFRGAGAPITLEDRLGRNGPMRFGDHVVLPAARTLLFRGAPIALGSRAFDLLIALLESRGEIVSKEELIRRVWPSTVVEEGNLRFQMARLRTALGCDRSRIKTVSGRGYLFAAGPQVSEAAC
jgi:DNA-binding winged helix-turn-helix (wHTH) protein